MHIRRDSKHSKANSNHSKEIRSIPIRTIRKAFEAFKFKFELFERDSKHLNGNSSHSKGIRSIRILIRTIRKKFEAFYWKFEPFERDSKHSNSNLNYSKKIPSFRNQIRTIRPTSNHSIGIRTIQMEIVTIRKGFKAFESKF